MTTEPVSPQEPPSAPQRSPLQGNEDKLTDALFANWLRARPALDVHGTLKASPEDFLVVEQADHAQQQTPDGPHLYFFLEKRDLTSIELVRMLADANGIPHSSIGYAGMKDKVAVTRQWLSVPLQEAPPDVTVPDGVRELARLRCTKKLRRGWLTGNTFELVVRDIAGTGAQPASDCRALIDERLSDIARTGVPNYFGPQRFGRNNVPAAIAWLPRRRKERNAFRRGLHLSVLRSFLFNEVLSARLSAEHYAAWTEADGAILDGPMWGRGRVQASQADTEFERAVLARHERICIELEFAGLHQERRALRLKPANLSWDWRGGATLRLSFGLPPGTYATSILRELGNFQRPGAMR